MKTELELVRQQHLALGLPLRNSPDARAPLQEITSRRRLVRVETEDFLNGGLWADDLVQIAVRLGRVAFCVAGALAQFGVEPHIRDMAEASTQLIAEARKDFDSALQVSDWAALKIACVKLELVWYGIAASIGLPYGDILDLLHEHYMAGKEVDLEAVRALLAKAGLPVKAAA